MAIRKRNSSFSSRTKTASRVNEKTDREARLTELLDELLILVEILETLSVLELQTQRSSFLAVVGIAQHTHTHLWSWNVWKLDVSSETLVLLRVILLQSDLELNGLHEVALLLCGTGQHAINALAQVVV